MTYEQWLAFTIEAAYKFLTGDISAIENIAQQLKEMDEALSLMEKYHYRVVGQSLMQGVKLMLSELEGDL